MNALAGLVRSAARASGAVVADGRTSSPTREVVRQAETVAREVALLAKRPRPVVAVVLPASTGAVTHLLAAIIGDHTVCFVDPADRARADRVLGALKPDVVVDAEGTRAQPPGSREWSDSGSAGYVAMSSGTTGGGPKGVLTTWECLADFAPHGIAALDIAPASSWAEPNHPAYDLALTNWLLALAAGASLHVSASLADRVRPLAFLSRREATHVRLAPGYVDLAASEAARGAPCAVRVWGSGGDRLAPDRAATVLGLGQITLVNTYGTSETAGFASAAAYTRADDLRAQDGSVSAGIGRLGPWRAELVAEELWGTGSSVVAVHSPHVGSGYLFGGSSEDHPRWERGRVVTGDLGVFADGDLFCLGRVGRLVKRSASFVNLDDVDAVLRDVRGIASFTVATRGGSLVTLLEGGPHALPEVREDLASRVAPAVLPDRLVPVRTLPRLGNGKTDHAGALWLAERALEQVD
jgi:acyl-coenzyme A synthetase/AMP-(fatty) acid ligase